MYINHSEIVEHLKTAAQIQLNKVFVAGFLPLPPSEFMSNRITPSRFIMPLTGKKRIVMANNQTFSDVILTPGDIIFSSYSGWIWEDWTSIHEMISVVFWPEMIRVIYINQSEPAETRNGPDVYFHTSKPLNGAGRLVLDALTIDGLDNAARRPLLEALLLLVLRAVCDDYEKNVGGKSRATWLSIDCYLRENLNQQLDRIAVADIFKIHPVHVSRLCQQFTSMGFGNYINCLRLSHATGLLKKSKMTVDEISFECGYNYSSHFTRCFKQHYGLSPTSYRNAHRN